MQPWSRQLLQSFVAGRIEGLKLIAVSNREPYIHRACNGEVECIRPAGGLTSALDPVMQASGGTWIAHGSGDADRRTVNGLGQVRVPPAAPCYTLRRVWLPPAVEREYYYGLANEGLWPLFHNAFHRPQFDPGHWESYRRANEIFAEAVLDEAGGDPALVFVQDYHFGLLPAILKRRNPRLAIAHFWHIPWPNRETFGIFPWKEELLEGLLGSDLLGFHLQHHCANFLGAVERHVEALVDTECSRVSRRRRVTQVQAFPIGIDFEEHSRTAAGPEVEGEMDGWRFEIGRVPEILGIGIDRIDYTKGIPEKLRALDALLESHPEYIGRLTFVQVGVPSRTAIQGYRALSGMLQRQISQMNRKWRRGAWEPVVFIHRQVERLALMALHRMADFCVISSLHDGMNLVAKEFAASRNDEGGALILSEFAGAARELSGALLVNPFAIGQMANAMHQAITMSPEEKCRRMVRIREAVAFNNVYRWAGRILETLADIAETSVSGNSAGETRLAAEAA